MKRFRLLVVSMVVLSGLSFVGSLRVKKDPEFVSIQNRWVDSVFNSLSAEQRLGQLFMVAAYSNKDLKHAKEIKDLIVNYNIGGLIWMQGGPGRQGPLANYYQTVARVPLLYSIDGEWGLAMRLDSTIRYPRQMTLGAIQNDSLIYAMGRQIARECKRLGIHINFAPVLDVNNNPANPVIGMRSFGENKEDVARKAYMYMQGLQDEHVMANGKHFPGHGDTDSDSHATLPYMTHSYERLDSLELYPFRYLFDRGLASIMVAHLSIPSLDTTRNLASTLSPAVVKDLLKGKLGFKGLVFTDALNMKGVSKFYEPGGLDVKALMAGNDVLLFSENVPKAFEEIKKAIADGRLTQAEIDERCKRILQAKYWCGLNKKQAIVSRQLYKDLNTKEGEQLNDRLAEAALTLLKNEDHFLPLRMSDTLRVAEVSFGVEEKNTLYEQLRGQVYTEHIGLPHDAKAPAVTAALEKIAASDVVVIQINKTTIKSDNNYGIGQQTLRLADSIARIKPTVLLISGNPYLLNKIGQVNNYKAVIMGYEYLPSLLKASASAIMGNSTVNGKLPVSTALYKAGSGLELVPLSTKKVSAGERSKKKRFGSIDSIALAGIAEKAYPGCQIVALQNGVPIYQHAFGGFTYAHDAKAVDDGSIYDLASITKIASTSLALMKLASEGRFDYHKELGDYLPYLRGTNKEHLRIEDVLTHQAGLQAWIPFYLRTLDKRNGYKKGYYSTHQSDQYPTQVAKKLFVVQGFRDTIYKRIVDSKLEEPGKYLYSDLGYYFLQQIIENITGRSLNDYVKDIYAQLGLTLTYKPLNYFSLGQVVPTENDEKFRKQTVRGYVHDPGAALLGGVAGHAGLFGNAMDLARLMQLYLDKGQYNGVQILDSNVVKDFTSCHFCPNNRRGLCFEKPEPDPKKESPVNELCSPESFGHSGFTGTFAWADPVNKLVLVFLSNRVYPNAEENKLAKLGIRGKIHKAFYEVLNQ